METGLHYNVAACVAALLFLVAPVAGVDRVSFRNDIMPIFAKAGCNAGTCHGNLNGKGGFRLSLRGQDPDRDYRTLTRGQFSRRLNPFAPDQSLLLRKVTATIPHEGGKRFDKDSPFYKTLRAWVAAGMPADRDDAPRLVRLEVSPKEKVLIAPATSVRITAKAHFSDGSSRDVTDLAVYELSNLSAEMSHDGVAQRLRPGETTVIVRFLDKQRPVRLTFIDARPGFAWSAAKPSNYIDEHVFAKLKTLRMNPSAVADDSTFVRRVYLDLLGVPPTPGEARAFVNDDAADKRAKLVDALLKRPEFADFWALKWSDLLRNEEKVIDAKGVDAFHDWIRQSLTDNKPLDRFVRELITGLGSTYKEPASNYYRALRNPSDRAEATAQLFLGTRMQCAKCHNHPFDRWTQDDYYGFAAFFAKIDYKIVENKRRDENDKHMFIGEQIVNLDGKGEVKHPNGGRVVRPAFLGADTPKLDGAQEQLEALAQWLTSPDNRRFARAQVNRIWYHLLGQGLVDPIDDFRATNPPSHPALLDALAEDFAASGFDVRHMIRVICASKTYQLSAVPNESNAHDDQNFARAVVRRLSAEQLVDAMAAALDTKVSFNGYDGAMRAGQLSGVNRVFRDKDPTPADRFLTLFGKPQRLTNCECERSNDTALGQVFELTSGELINELLTAKDNRIGKLIEAERSDKKIVKELYWAALSRAPSKVELDAALDLIERADDRRAAIEDVAWGLLNAKAFVLRH